MDVGSPLKGKDGVDNAPLGRSAIMDNVLCYVIYLLFYRFYLFIMVCNLSSAGDEWSTLLRYLPERVPLRQAFENLPNYVFAMSSAT